MQLQSLRPQKETPCAKTSHMIYRPVTSVHPFYFCTVHPFTQHPKILCCIMLFNRPETSKMPLPVVASTSPCNAYSLDPRDSTFQTASRLIQPFLHRSLLLSCASSMFRHSWWLSGGQEGKLSGLFCAVLCATIVHSELHTHMNRPNSSLDWVLSHWAHFTVFRLIFVHVLFCVWLYNACMCNIVTWWGVPGGIEAWSLGPLLRRVLWHCWLGHLTRKWSE